MPEGLEDELDDLMNGLSDKVGALRHVALMPGHNRQVFMRQVSCSDIFPPPGVFRRANRHGDCQSLRWHRRRACRLHELRRCRRSRRNRFFRRDHGVRRLRNDAGGSQVAWVLLGNCRACQTGSSQRRRDDSTVGELGHESKTTPLSLLTLGTNFRPP